MKKYLFLLVLLEPFFCLGQIDLVWLTHSQLEPNKLVVSWFSELAGDSVVKFGTDKNNLQTVSKSENVNLHHVEIPLEKKDCDYFYSVSSGSQSTPIYSFKGYPSKGRELRIALVGNMGGNSSRLKEVVQATDPHLIMTCGDNIPALFDAKNPYKDASIYMYKKMVANAPEVFRSRIFMPILGNHDKQTKPRGKTRPQKDNPVYDISAKSYCEFFSLPSPEWHWQMRFSDFDLRLIALDTNHISDISTGWQSCHEVGADSEQFQWFDKVLSNSSEKYIIAFYNESNGSMRGTNKGIWTKLFDKCSLCVSGYGHYLELAKTPSGMFYANNSFVAGAHYKDKSNAIFSEPKGGFILLKFPPSGQPTITFFENKKAQLFTHPIISRPAKK